jgi:hypothetical protein
MARREISETFRYKIQSQDGTFSTGGENPRFTSKGKVWASRAHLHVHLRNLANRKVYANCNLITIKVLELIQETQSVKAFLADEREREQEERNLLKTLQRKYGDAT